MRRVLLLLSLGALIAVPGIAQAQSLPDLSWQMFDPGDDWSAQVIRGVFPSGAGGAQEVANQRTVLGLLVGLFSGVVGMVAITWIVYSVIWEVFRAGKTGQFLDHQNKVLAPLRFAFAAIMMIPSPNSGVSFGQTMVVQAAMSSIGITRTLYAFAVKSVGLDAVPVAEPIIPGTKTVIAGLLQNELCRALINVAANNPAMMPPPQPIMGGNAGTGAYVTWAYSLAAGNETASPVCGTVTVRQPTSISGTNIMGVSVDMTDQQRQILGNVLQTSIRPRVEQIAASLWQTRQAAAMAPLMDVYVSATNSYTQQLTTAATSITQQLRAAVTADRMRLGEAQNMDRLAALGWTGAGAYSLELSRLNGATLSLLSAVPVITAPSYAGLGPNLSADLAPLVHSVMAWRDRISTYVQTTDGLDVPGGYSDLFTGATPGDDGAGLLERVARSLRVNERVANAFLTALSPSQTMWQNPFVAQIQLGHKLIIIAMSALGLASMLASTTGAAGTVAVSVLTGNFTAAGAAATGHMVMQYLGTPIFYGLMCLLLPGLILAFVLPLLPFAMWFAGVLGWLILVFEVVVAVPLWMFAHLTWRGEGLHGRGFEGYAALANILFRPALMLIGLHIGYVVYAAATWLLARSFGVAAGFVLANGWLVSNLLGVVVLLAAFVILHIVATTQSFRLISLAPHHVVRYAGIAPAGRVDMDAVSQQAGVVGLASTLQSMQGGLSTALEAAREEGQRKALAAPVAGTSDGAGGMDRTVAASSDIMPPPRG